MTLSLFIFAHTTAHWLAYRLLKCEIVGYWETVLTPKAKLMNSGMRLVTNQSIHFEDTLIVSDYLRMSRPTCVSVTPLILLLSVRSI